ncbi:GPI-anchored surface protein, putative, partial [Bodo saltans]
MWAAVCALMALAIVVYAHLGHTSLRLATEALGVPSPLLPLIVHWVPSTVSSTFYLLHSPGCGTDGVVAAVGVMMIASPLIVISLAAFSVPRCLTLVKQEQKRTPHSYAARLMSTLFHRRVRWRGVRVNAHTLQIATSVKTPTSPAAPPSGTAGAWLRAATVLLLDYAVVWYAFVDVAVLTASCVLGALGMLKSASLCRGGAIAILVMYIVQLVLCAAVWPFTTLFSHAYALFTLAMSSIAVICQVWYLYGSVADNADLDALRRLLTAAAVCDLLVSGVSMLKTLMDVVDGVKACRRHITALSTSSVLASAAAVDGPLRELHLADDAVLHNRSLSLSTSTIIDEGFAELAMPTSTVEGGSAGGIVTAREIAVYEI